MSKRSLGLESSVSFIIRYICYTLSIPPYSSVELVQGGAKFVLNSGDALKATASSNSSIDLITSIVDAISTAP